MDIKLKELLIDTPGNLMSFCQTPFKWLRARGFEELADRVVNKSTDEIKLIIAKECYGVKYCSICGEEISLLRGNILKKGWRTTCSQKCHSKSSSLRMMGDGNSCHKMTDESKRASAAKQSSTMKSNILLGKFTPKSNNSRTHTAIEVIKNDNVYKTRSSWEALFLIESNIELSYEKKRIHYFSTDENKDRIYIADFYDIATNEIIEIKPDCNHETQLSIDKIKGVHAAGYLFKFIGNAFIYNEKRLPTLLNIKQHIINYSEVKHRFDAIIREIRKNANRNKKY